MPRRRVLTEAQLHALLALPTVETELIRHYTLSPADLAVIHRRRQPHNRLGFALQLCAFRYPGRIVKPGEIVPMEVVTFLAEQVGIDPDSLADYATRAPTRYDHLDALRATFGFHTLSQPDRAALAVFLRPVALATTSGVRVAEALMAELRQRGVAAPGPTVIERLAATALLEAERHAADTLNRRLSAGQRAELDALLRIHPGTAVSALAWARQPAGAPGARSLSRLVEQIDILRRIGIDPDLADGVHADRVKQLAREGARLTAQHLRTLAPARRRAILAVTALETIARLADEAIGLFDRLIGRLLRRAERRAAADLQNSSRTINEKLRLLAKIGDALVEAREVGADAFAAMDRVVAWNSFTAAVAETKDLIRPDGPDYAAMATANHAMLRRVGPLFLNSFEFRSVAAATGVIRAAEALRAFYAGDRRTWPKDMPTAFIRRSWRAAVFREGVIDGKAYELCFFVEVRDRLRAGDVWVVGSRQYRAVEDQLIAKALFAEMRLAGPLPVAAPPDAWAWLQERKALLGARLRRICEKAESDQLPDVRLSRDALKIAPLEADAPEAVERLADRIYGLLPRVRITDLLEEVADWTGAAECSSTAAPARTDGMP